MVEAERPVWRQLFITVVDSTARNGKECLFSLLNKRYKQTFQRFRALPVKSMCFQRPQRPGFCLCWTHVYRASHLAEHFVPRLRVGRSSTSPCFAQPAEDLVSMYQFKSSALVRIAKHLQRLFSRTWYSNFTSRLLRAYEYTVWCENSWLSEGNAISPLIQMLQAFLCIPML